MAYKQTAPIPPEEGGTGGVSFTAYAVICGGTTGTGDLQSITSVGNSGDVLTSAGAGALPAFMPAGGGSLTINADSGSVTPSGGSLNANGSHGINTLGFGSTLTFAVNNTLTLGDITPVAPGDHALEISTGNVQIDAGNLTLPATTDSSTGVLVINANPFLHAFGTNNTFVGKSCGNFTSVGGGGNVGLGTNALLSLDTATSNVAIGVAALFQTDSSSANVAVGGTTLSGLVNGNGNNTAVGAQAGSNLSSGAHNCLIGESAGSAYNSSESSNIVIGSQIAGGGGESNTLRIGNGTGASNGQLQQVFISGIQGVNAGSVATVVSISGDQLGTTTLTGGLGMTITPTANTITFDVTGGVTSLAGDSGSSTTGSVTITGGTTGLEFAGSGSTITASFAGITVSGGPVSIGTDIADDNINIGTNASSGRPIAIGNGTGSTSVTVDCGTGGASFGTTANAHTTTIGSTSGMSSTTIQGGAQGVTLSGIVTAPSIFNTTVAITGVPVVIDATGLMGTIVSSLRYKENIEDMEDDSSSVLELRPVTFNYKSDALKSKCYGLIAEEVADVLPDLVVYTKEGDCHTVKYQDLPILLLNELQKALKRIDTLERRMNGKY